MVTAKIKICADGGANHLFQLIQRDHLDQANDMLPDAIVGDLDSLLDDVKSYFIEKVC